MTKEEIKDIAANLDMGFKCFIHNETKNIKVIPDRDKHPDMDTEVWDTDIKEIKGNRRDYIEIRAMDSDDSFRLMTDFAETVDNEVVKERLEQALTGVKPFKNFKFQVDNSGPFREKWFRFKGKRLVDWVEDQLKDKNL
jgi:hypothetical protein